MTEREWESSHDLPVMLWSFHEDYSDRKLRLFIIACCRRVWHLFTDERYRKVIEIAEGYLEGIRNGEELEEARQGAISAKLDSHVLPLRVQGCVRNPVSAI